MGAPEGVGPYQTTWQQQLDLVGQALGRGEQADELQAEVEQQFTEAAAANPAFAGTEVAVGAYTSEGFGAYVRGDTRVDFMEALGFTNDAAVQDLAGESFSISLSEEQVPLLDAPLTVVFPIFVEAAQITDNPLWQSLPSVQQGNALVLEDETLVNAFSSGSAPGTRYALENAVPLFAETLGQEKDPVPLTPRTLGASLRTGPWAGRPPSSVTGPAPGPPAPARSAVRGGAAPPRR